MARIALFLALAVLWGQPALAASSDCRGFELAPFLDGVPYLAKSMRRAEAPDGMARFVHPDEERISLTVGLRPVPEGAPTTRSDFVRDTHARILSENGGSAGLIATVSPYEPVTWTVQSRNAVGDSGVDSRGVTTIRIAPTCHLVAAWQVFETASLVNRIKEFNGALDSIKKVAAAKMAPHGFLEDSTIPIGWRSVWFGAALPLLASLALMFTLRSMLFYGDPGSVSRMLAGAGAGCVGMVLLSHLPAYFAGFPEGRFVDTCILLSTVGAALALAAATGWGRLVLPAFSVSLIAALTLGVEAYLGWTPSPVLAGILAVALAGTSVGGLWAWHSQASAPRFVAKTRAGSRREPSVA